MEKLELTPEVRKRLERIKPEDHEKMGEMARYLKLSIERPVGADGCDQVARDVATGYARAGGGSVDETVDRIYGAFEQTYGVTPAQYHAYIETKAPSAYDKYGAGHGLEREKERDEGLER